MLIHFGDRPNISFPSSTHEDRLFIPVLNVKDHECTSDQDGYGDEVPVDHLDLSNSGLTNVEIWVQPFYWLRTLNLFLIQRSYDHYLNCWCLVGPIITLEWLRRTKKFCWMSGGQQLNNNGQTDENEAEIRTMEEGGNRTKGSHLHSIIENYRDRDDEEQPLLTTQPTVINEYMRQSRGTGCVNIIRKISLREIAVGFLYMILVIAALPVGLSNGGFSFFIFDLMLDGKRWPIYSVWPTFQIRL